MWLKRITQNEQNNMKQSNYGTGSSQSGGAGSDLGISSNCPSGQGQLFAIDSEILEQDRNYNKRKQNRKKIERQRKWRLSKDRKQHL